MKAYGYCRVSSMEQVEGTSLNVQHQQIEAYAALKGIDLVSVYHDAGISGGTPIAARPEGSKMVEALQDGEAEAVIIVKLDRAFRSALDCLQTIERWQKATIALHIVDLGGTSIDTSTTMGKFMLTVLAASAEMERGMIKDRCNSGRRARKLEGKRIGEIPFGYSLADDGRTLVVSDQEQEAITLALDLKSKGYTASGIAAELNYRGIATKKGKIWTHKQVIRLLARAA